MRMLIVEDDAALGPLLQRGMRLEGYETELVTDGETAVTSALEHQPDLIVLDLNLPCKDGVQVLEELYGRVPSTSILVLTGRSTVQERVRCLNIGADDCMLKPFSLKELTARCNALTRRRNQFADPVLRHGDIELNRLDRKVMRNGCRVDLTVKEFSLLEYLMQARGRCCSRSELLREVWQMSPDAGTNVVDVYINYLRKKLGAGRLGELSDDRQFIETVRGAGYMLSPEVRRRPSVPVLMPIFNDTILPSNTPRVIGA
ncbi:response regulator transcription factor [Granulicella sp. WH15]|uniref:response regulator transcription factor n=1 Tax=Granulicella sp. WH15 TaxID=2602070 RepID=UPI001366E37C|nr:response regulator transcription factor [Granulicella sp. WH15]QHN03926.1 response regulator transcription factor [Granulicella sp. WH15]